MIERTPRDDEVARDKMRERIRRLPLAEFRKELLTCNVCFADTPGCWHHEDVVGGYRTGCIAVVGLNPQAHPSEPVYQTIRESPWGTKVWLSDQLLEIFAERVDFAAVDPQWAWLTNRHPGIRRWLPQVADHFGLAKTPG